MPLSKLLSLTVFVLGAGVASGGCVPTGLELGADHPARPEAAPGRAADPADMLRPGSALRADDGAPESPAPATSPPDGTRANPFVGRGTIREVRESALVIAHEAIPGFMGAMTMAYAVAVSLDVAGLVVGDAVTFRIELPESGGYRIFAVERADGGGAQ
jgi:hypothetical protein